MLKTVRFFVACGLFVASAGAAQAVGEGVFSGHAQSSSRQQAVTQARMDADNQAKAANALRISAPDKVQEDCDTKDGQWFCTIMLTYNH